MKIKNTKGFAYLLTASFIVVVLLVVFLTLNKYKYQDRQNMYEQRIRLVDDFINNFDEDIHRATYITSFRTLLALEDHIAQNGVFLNNTELLFAQLASNGTLNGTNPSLLINSTLNDYLDKVNSLASSVGIHSNFTLVNITLYQSSPWEVSVVILLDIEVNDTKGLASWSFRKSYLTKVPIYDLRDPLYSHFTSNRVPNTIRRLSVPFLINDSDNDSSNLITHLNESYYLASSFAPSFLQRFENNLSPSPYGIESVVNINILSDQDLEVFPNRAKLDYIYFNNISQSNLTCNFNIIPSDLYTVLPMSHLALYDLDTLNSADYSTSCS